MSYNYSRTVRFQDTDAAGVVFFANVLAMCHEAYEASLAASGVNLKAFFSNSNAVIPIVSASVDFRRPMYCGDVLIIELTPQKLGDDELEIAYKIFNSEVRDKWVAKAVTRHVCINPDTRKRQELSQEILAWLSGFGGGVRNLD